MLSEITLTIEPVTFQLISDHLLRSSKWLLILEHYVNVVPQWTFSMVGATQDASIPHLLQLHVTSIHSAQLLFTVLLLWD